MEGPYLTVEVGAGLGNQLFMIAAGFAMSHFSPNTTLIFCDADDGKGRPKCWTGFLSECSEIQTRQVSRLPSVSWNRIGDLEHPFSYSNYLGIIRRNVRQGISTHITGYFQNKRYLPEKQVLFRIFNIHVKQTSLQEKISGINFETTCSLHFRIGDYKKYSNVHTLLTDDYYREAINQMKSLRSDIKKLLIFNENEDQQQVEQRVSSLIQNKDLEVCYASSFKLKDWEEMILMSLCSANIIANSTFSWWGAYFNCHVTSTVIYPHRWINHVDSLHLDIAQTRWIKV